ncbi:MAG: PHP domain-containing protein, partial [Myxococcota bacterium]|nr:PHP domain-containing protein [Myxococcota bacterium]
MTKGENKAKIECVSPLAPDYVELRARSAFSFLEGASNPEDLALRAAEWGYSSLALADSGGVYGIPRFHSAARSLGLNAIVGAEIDLEFREIPHPLRLRFLVESARGWKHLSRLLTRGHRGRAKNECQISEEDLEEHGQDLTVLIRGDEH